MSKKISTDSVSASQTEPKMESSLSPDAMSEQIFAIEDALLQASQELPNVTSNSNQATTSKDTKDQEDDFVYVEKPKKAAECTKDENLPFDFKPPHLPDNPEHLPHVAETKPPTLLDNPVSVPQDAETKPPTLHDNPQNVPQDAEIKTQTLHDDTESHNIENKLPSLVDDPENVQHDAENNPPPLIDSPENVPHDAEVQIPSSRDNPERRSPNKIPSTPDSNTGCPGYSSKYVFLGGVLVGAAIMAVGIIIYTNFESPPDNASN